MNVPTWLLLPLSLAVCPPAVQSAALSEKPNCIFILGFHEGPESKQAIRMGDWKAVRFGGPGGKLELYDLKTDLGEQRNLAAAHPGIAAQVEKALNAARTPNPIWPLKHKKGAG